MSARVTTSARLLVIVAILVLISAGCGKQTSTGSLGTSASPQSYAFDPPRRFADTSVEVGSGPLAIVGSIAYSYTDTALVATDLATGSQRWSVPLPGADNLVTGPMMRNNPTSPAVITDNNGKELIVASYYTTVEGSGTQQATDQTQVVAVDTGGHVRWNKAVQPADLRPQAVGELHDRRGVAVVVKSGGSTVVLDTISGELRWTANNVTPQGVDGDKVIGVQSGSNKWEWRTVALRGADGTETWAGPIGRSAIARGFPPFLITGSGRLVIPDHHISLVDTATGKLVASLTPEGFGRFTCLFDGRDVIVCSQSGGLDLPDKVIGVDANTGQQLWELPSANRTTLNVKCAFHGAVYGYTENGNVILDARTGNDAVINADLDPTQVVPGYGLVTDWTSTTRDTKAYRAVG